MRTCFVSQCRGKNFSVTSDSSKSCDCTVCSSQGWTESFFLSSPFPLPPPPSPVGRFIRALKTFHHRHWFDSGWNHSEMVIIITGSHQLFCSRKFFKWNCCQTWFGILWCFFERFIWPKVVRWLWHQLMLNSYECKFQSDVHADMFSFFRSPIRAI